MKTYRRARVTLLGDYAQAFGHEVKSPLTATVFMNGSAAVINVPVQGHADERLDRIIDATRTEHGDGTVSIKGRSEYLEGMNLIPEDQQVEITVKGGKCETC